MEFHQNLELENITYLDYDGILKTEQWKDIMGYEGLYIVSDLSRVKSLQREVCHKMTGVQIISARILKSANNGTGYRYVCLCKDHSVKNFKVYRLSAVAFIPNPENKPDINHINGVKSDNRCVNLEWCTKKENSTHAFRTGLNNAMKGSSHVSSKLTEKQVLEIRENKNGLLQKDLAVIYKVSKTVLNNVINLRTYKTSI